MREENQKNLEKLWQEADRIRSANVGIAVFLRGLIEISNYCRQKCHYCGLRAENRQLQRYRMSTDEILICARQAKKLGYGTVVLQAGEDAGITQDWMTALILKIKHETGLAITLSLGERNLDELQAWRIAGADRYLLRFETSNQKLFKLIHPGRIGSSTTSDRIYLLKELRRMGYEIGSGVMIGIPGQSYDDLVADLELFQELDLDMIGIGPFIAHPNTPLGNQQNDLYLPAELQVPNTELMTYKVLALTRLVCPRANLPSTTALASLNYEQGRELGLMRGANIVMPNLTPPHYRKLYEIYPAKACIRESFEQFHAIIKIRIASINRSIGIGPGSAIKR